MKEERRYKNKYHLVFYDKDDEIFRYVFKNPYEIVKYLKLEPTQRNLNIIRQEIYRALKRENGRCRFIKGESLCLHIFDFEDEDI